MKSIYNFIVKSSADPEKTSLTIKGIGLMAIPYLLNLFDVACEFGQQCYQVNASTFEVIVQAVADGTFYALSFLSAWWALYGAVRKLFRTITGTNSALLVD